MEQRGYGQEYINRYMMTRKLLLNSSFLMVQMDMVYELLSTSTEYANIPILGCRLRTSVHFPVPSHSCTRLCTGPILDERCNLYFLIDYDQITVFSSLLDAFALVLNCGSVVTASAVDVIPIATLITVDLKKRRIVYFISAY
ncbi:hypothetical protein L1987_15551 [Smallanthus sonchifolius]|uniref:Uncharacterized protein n=1 Tax=Smallanthus sonchifolius TaxID=185202 RepID=A0ACB9J863_9ASTR|nr:hypothetical protein L1987_15551 [Smallanthus sonchifolius]